MEGLCAGGGRRALISRPASYWTDNIDGHPQDRYTYLLLHELRTLSTTSSQPQIVDHGISRWAPCSRLIITAGCCNADNYSMMAFHRAFGKSRLRGDVSSTRPGLND